MSMTKLKLKAQSREVALPVSGRKVKIRPYTVGEEMALFLSKESNDPKAIADSIGNIVDSITDGKIDPAKDSYIDVIYAYMIGKAISAGEISKVKYSCGCGGEGTVQAEIDVSKIKTEVPKRAEKIVLDAEGGDVTFNLRPIPFDAFVNTDGTMHASAKLFRECVVSIVDESGEKIDHENATDDEWNEFYSSFPAPAMRKIVAIFETEPRAWIDVVGKCAKCGKDVPQTFEGLGNFT